MKSENARFLRQGMVELCRKMTPAQRVRAFIEHSRVMKRIHEAGERRRKERNLIGGIPRLDPDFFVRSTEDEFDGMRFRMASPEDLIALKVYAGGPKDIEDAKGVIEVQEAGIDNELVIRLCKRFGREAEAVCRKLLLPPQ